MNESANPEVESPAEQPEPEATAEELAVPPFVLLFCGFLVVCCLWYFTHYRKRTKYKALYREVRLLKLAWVKDFVFDRLPQTQISSGDNQKPTVNLPSPHTTCTLKYKDVNPLLGPPDIQTLNAFKCYQNNSKDLFKICIPAVLTLLFCPLTLFLHRPMVKMFWPPELYKTPPMINEAVACFLAPAGMVYAVSFGFAFQQVLSKQLDITRKIHEEIGQIDQLISMTNKIHFISSGSKLNIFRALKSEVLHMISQFMNKSSGSTQYKNEAAIWNILDYLRDASKSNDLMDDAICRRMLKYVIGLNNASESIGGMHIRMHFLQWIFLETLGYFSFLGVLMIRAESYRLELSMCILTVISITMLCFIVADLDSPFHGFFRINLSGVLVVVQKLEGCYLRELKVFSSNLVEITEKISEA